MLSRDFRFHVNQAVSVERQLSGSLSSKVKVAAGAFASKRRRPVVRLLARCAVLSRREHGPNKKRRRRSFDGGPVGLLLGIAAGLALQPTRRFWMLVRTLHETDHVFSLPEEWRRSLSWQQRHRVLVARLTFLLTLTFLIALVGTVAIYFLERHARGTEINTVFDAFYFTAVQLLTVSSSLKNPLNTGGRILNILFEIWGVLFVGGTAGALATFFLSDDGQ